MLRLVVLLVAGAMGACIAVRIRMPGGSFLGAMLVTAAISLSFAEGVTVPTHLRSMALILVGVGVGASVKREEVLRLRSVLPVAMVLVLVFIAAAVGIGQIVVAVSGDVVSPATLVLGVMPGGASGLAAAAIDLGADVAIMASMHSLRLLVVCGLLPAVLRWLSSRHSTPPA